MTQNPEMIIQPRVVVIGTGTMGSAMTARLLGSGLEVGVWSRHAASTERSIELGAPVMQRAADVMCRDISDSSVKTS